MVQREPFYTVTAFLPYGGRQGLWFCSGKRHIKDVLSSRRVVAPLQKQTNTEQSSRRGASDSSRRCRNLNHMRFTIALL
jgi:hypothetical protein